MQEGFYNYYNIGVGEGCCLNCYEAREGCLCYDCKCKKCYWYSTDGYNGHCEKTDALKEQRKKEAKERYQRECEEDYAQVQALKKHNQKVEEKIKADGEIPSWYSCQGCHSEFVTDKELKIVIKFEPLCPICTGEISKGG